MNAERYAQYYRLIRENIDEYGVFLQGVGPGEDTPPFTYTIGLAEKGLPELIVNRFIGDSVGVVLNILSAQLNERKKPFELGEMVDVGGDFKVKIGPVDLDLVRKDFTVQAGQFLGREDYDVQQVIICDKSGRYPGDEDCEEYFDGQLLAPTVH